MSLQSGSFLVMRPLARSPRSLPDVCGRLLALPPGLQPLPLRGPLGLPRAGRNSIAKTDHWLSDRCSEFNSRVPLSGGAARADVCGRLLALLAPCRTSAAIALRLCSPISQILLLLLRHLQSPAAIIKAFAAVEANSRIISRLFLTTAIHCRYHESVHYRGNKFALPCSKPVLP